MGRSAVGLLSLSAGTYAAIALSALVAVVLTRALGSEEFGRLALLLVVAQSLDLAVSSWSLPVLVRFGANEWVTRGTISSTLWARSVIVAIPTALAIAGVLVFAGPLASYLAVSPNGILLIVGFFIATGLTQTAGSLLRATDRMARQGVSLVLEKAALLGLVVASWLVLDLDAEAALTCYVIAALVAAAWSFAQLGLRALRPVPVTLPRVRELGGFAVPLVVGSLAGLFGNQAIDYVVIRAFLPFSELGRYAVAYQLAGILQQLLIVTSAFLLPRISGLLAQGRDEEVHRAVARLAPYWLVSFSASCALGIIAAPLAVPLIFGDAFSGAVAPLRVLLVSAAVAAVFSVFGPLLTAHGVLWPVTRGVVIAVTLNVALDILLVPPFGLTGAALATLVAYSVTAAFALVAARRRLGLPSMRYALFVVPAAAALISSLAFEGWTATAVGLAAVGAVSAILVRGFRLFTAGDRAFLAQARTW